MDFISQVPVRFSNLSLFFWIVRVEIIFTLKFLQSRKQKEKFQRDYGNQNMQYLLSTLCRTPTELLTQIIDPASVQETI